MWNIRPWPTSDDLKPMNHVSNSSFMRRDYQKCFTYDMSHMFHGYQVPNRGVMKRFYIFLIFIKNLSGPIKIGSKLRHPRNLCRGRTVVIYLCIHDETACWGLKIDFFQKITTYIPWCCSSNLAMILFCWPKFDQTNMGAQKLSTSNKIVIWASHDVHWHHWLLWPTLQTYFRHMLHKKNLV
jgi:hypothetical protein